MKVQINPKVILISALVIILSGFQIASALPSVNILGNYAVVGTGLNATTSAQGNFTASGTIVFTSLGSAGNPLLSVSSDGTISTSSAGVFTTTSINGLSTTTFTFATGTTGDALNITTSSNAITFNVPMATNLVRGLVSIASQTFAGLKTFATGLIAQTRLGIPADTTLTNSGDIGITTTSSTLKFHDGTGERAINPIITKTLTVPNPTSTDTDFVTNNIRMGHFDQAFTITKISCISVSTSSSATIQIYHATSSNQTGANLFSAAQVCSNTTSSLEFTSFNDATLIPDEMVWVDFTAASSSQTSITLFGRYDP